jgi:tRNA-dihydrouridine synthase
VPKIVRRGAGAGLIKDPDRLCAIIRALKSAIRLPVTVKTRIGASPRQCAADELSRRIEGAGADGLALHARFTSERHSGPADWDLIAEVKARLRIPVVGNGGVVTAAQAIEFQRKYGVDGVMIGRAAIGNPWLFDEIRARLAGRSWTPPALAERRALIAEHLAMTVAFMARELKAKRKCKLDADAAGARHFRAHLIRYLSGLRGVTEMKRGLNDLWSSADVLRSVDAVLALNEASAGQDPPPM